jgi:hypothetical protein
MQQESLSMKKYVWVFFITYAACSFVIGGVLIYFDIDSNSPGLLITLISAFVAVQSFTKNHGRIPSKSETWSATWGSWLSTMLLTLVAVICIFAWGFYDSYGQISLADIKTELSALPVSLNIIYAISAVVSIIYLGLTRLAYGLANKILSKKSSGPTANA